jgi:hypothetical protein
MYVHILKKVFPGEFLSVVILSFPSNSVNFFARVVFLGCYTISWVIFVLVVVSLFSVKHELQNSS